MKCKVLICLLSLVSCLSTARERETGGNTASVRDWPRFTFGAETSYVLTFMNYSHFNFISADGDRRDERYTTFNVFNNGQILVHAGVNVSKNVNLAVYTGYGGVYKEERMIPLSLRATWLVGDDPAKNRWLVFCSAGTGFNDFDKPSKLSAEARIGGGYRISLNRVAKLDFLAGFQETYTHPLAYESDAGDYVPAERLRRNEAWFGALTFGLALVF